MNRNLTAFLAASACIAAIATPAEAQTRQYRIAAGSLKSALDAYARQSGRALIYKVDEIKRARSNGARGEMSADAALDAVLAGSGYRAQRTDSGAFGIVQAARTPAPQAARATGEADAGSAAADDESADIVVTAQKREERLIDTPQSVSVLTGDQLQRTGAVQFRDFADKVPALSFQTEGAGLSQISIRGVSVGKDAGATVGLYVDDVPFGSSSGFARNAQIALDAGLFDMERLEVLRGPQGTLYGASTLGGLIKYVSKRPDLSSLEGSVAAGISATRFGSINFDASGVVNVPIAQDRAALRATAYIAHDGGYVDNVTLGKKNVNRANTYGGRLDLLLRPTEALSVRIVGFLQNIDRDGIPSVDYSFSGSPTVGDLRQARKFDEYFNQKIRIASLTLDYDLGPATLTSVTSYQNIATNFFIDISPRQVPSLQAGGRAISAVGLPTRTRTEKTTQEVRVSSASLPRHASSGLEWVIGGFYTHEQSTDYQEYRLRDLAGNPRINDLFTFYVPSSFEELAIFGDLTLRLTPRFDATVGARYAIDRQTFAQTGTGAFGLSAPKSSASDDVVTYLANARYHFTPSSTAYIRYATGYRPGGPNFRVVDSTTGQPIGALTFGPDTLTSYEIGYKADLLGRAVSIDMAAYHIDWRHIQLTVTQGGFGARANAPGKAIIDGGEISLVGRPARGVTLAGAASYQDARMKDPIPALAAAAGERLPTVPKFTISGDAEIRLGWGPSRPTMGASFAHIGHRTSTFGPNAYQLPAYTTVDLRFGMKLGAVDLQLYARNIFDERGQVIPRVQGFASRTIPLPISILQPRTFGIQARMSF